MSKDEALNMALEYFESITALSVDGYKAEQACREALEQPAQDPVAWMVFDVYGNGEYVPNDNNKFFTKQTTATQKPIPLYTHPHQWQGLTDDEIWAMISKLDIAGEQEKIISNFARAIEQALKEKNI
jgi:hypothetical protein